MKQYSTDDAIWLIGSMIIHNTEWIPLSLILKGYPFRIHAQDVQYIPEDLENAIFFHQKNVIA